MELASLNFRELQKAVFVYNAVINGWTVKFLDDGKYEFEKQFTPSLRFAEPELAVTSNDGSIANQYLARFIRNNMSLDRLRVVRN